MPKEELAEGPALQHARVDPTPFSFPGNRGTIDCCPHGIRCHRECNVTRAFQMGPTVTGNWRASLVRRATRSGMAARDAAGTLEHSSSLFLYPIGSPAPALSV